LRAAFAVEIAKSTPANDDTFADILTATSAGPSTTARVFDGLTAAATDAFFAFGPGFTLGAFIGGDFDD
jgi:hypothetical protein